MTASRALWSQNSEDSRAAEKKGKMGPGRTGTLTPFKAPRRSIPFPSIVQSFSFIYAEYLLCARSWGLHRQTCLDPWPRGPQAYKQIILSPCGQVAKTDICPDALGLLIRGPELA